MIVGGDCRHPGCDRAAGVSDYIVRSKMSETEAAIAACKTSVAE